MDPKFAEKYEQRLNESNNGEERVGEVDENQS